jgi:hypothetical protein
VAAAVDEDDLVAGVEEGWELVCPVTAVTEAAVKEEDGGAGAEGGVVDLGTVVEEVGGVGGGGEGWGALEFESGEVVVVVGHRRFFGVGVKGDRGVIIW